MTDAAQSTLLTFDLDQRLPGAFHMPARMTAIGTSRGVVLVSPIPIDDTIAARIASLGEVRYLVAPNVLHHLYLAQAKARYPSAKVLGPKGLVKKQPSVTFDGFFEEGAGDTLGPEVDVVSVRGAPALAEVALFHSPSKTLVLTDLVFNVLSPRGLVAHVVLFLVGCYKRLAQSRALRLLVKDRAAAKASAEALLALPFETLVVAHGDVVQAHAKDRLRAALAWMLAG